MKKLNNKKAIITGASSGIGFEMSKILLAQGFDLLVVARSEKKLETLKSFAGKSLIHVLPLDLSVANSADKVIEFCEINNFFPSVLINNAGVGSFGNFSENSLSKQMSMLQLNMITLVDLTHKMIPLLKKNGEAFIMNVASTAAYQAMPSFALYAASKSFVLSFSRALFHELKPHNIHVTTLSPGPTESDFVKTANLDHIAEKAEKLNMKASVVAQIALDALFAGKQEIMPGMMNAFSSKLTRLVPRKMTEKFVKKMYE